MNQEKNFSLEASCVQLDVAASDWQEAIQKTCGPLLEGGYVKNGYSNDVIAREKQWATGLPTMPVGVAIPHALTPDNVVEAQIAACRLTTPVQFAQSGGLVCAGPGGGRILDDAPVDVRLVFVLALKDPKSQLNLLQKLMVAISDETMLTALLEAKTPLDFSNIFNAKEQ